MARVTIEDCLDYVADQFALVHLASQRYRQLSKGTVPLIDPGKNKLIVTALREIATGKVQFRENVHEVVAKAREKQIADRDRAVAATLAVTLGEGASAHVSASAIDEESGLVSDDARDVFEDSSVEEASIGGVSADDMSADEVSADDTSVDDMPADDMPADLIVETPEDVE